MAVAPRTAAGNGTLHAMGVSWRDAFAVGWLPITIALLSFGAAAIHFGVSPDHFAEYTLYGVFFVALGWFQVLWGAAYLVGPAARLGLVGAAVNIGVVAVWIYSRTIGLPIGPNPGSTEVLGLADSISSSFEVLIAVGVVAQLTVLRPRAGDGSSRGMVAALVAVAAVIAATIVALVALAPSGNMG